MSHGNADASSVVRKLKSAALGELSFPQPVEAYQTEMIYRAGDAVKTSKENAELSHDEFTDYAAWGDTREISR